MESLWWDSSLAGYRSFLKGAVSNGALGDESTQAKEGLPGG